MCASRPCLQVQGLAWALAEHRHPEMCAVQLLDILNVLRMFRKHPHAPAAGAPLGHWCRSSRSAVLPLVTNLESSPASHAPLLSGHRMERFLWALATMQVQEVLANKHSAPSSHHGGPSTGHCAPSRNQLAEQSKKLEQFKLSRWPWSMMGKQVRVHHIHGRHVWQL
jgi:hypothetical protein